MDDDPSRDIRGTLRDWPAGVISISALVWLAYWLTEQTPPPLLLALPMVGAIAWPLRRFSRNRGPKSDH